MKLEKLASYGKIFGETYTLYYNVLQNLTAEAVKQGLVLDAGCGPRGMPDPQVGVDISRENAKQYVNLTLWPKAKTHERMVVVASLEALPFRDDAFHAVLCMDVLEHVENKGLAVKELCRIGKQVIGCTSNLLNPQMLLDTLLPSFVAQLLSDKLTYGYGGHGHYQRHGIRFTPATISKAFQVANVKAEISVIGHPVTNRPFVLMFWCKLDHLTSWLHIPVGEILFFRATQ